MPEPTENEFKRHLNSKFLISFEERDFELELVEIKSHRGDDPAAAGMERFSAYFIGPSDLTLPQHTYPMQHPEMGVNYIFLVPVDQEDDGVRYEAVFNFYPEKQEGER